MITAAIRRAISRGFTVTLSSDGGVVMRHRDGNLVITAIIDGDTVINVTVVEFDGGGIYQCPMWQGSITRGLIRFIDYYTSTN